VIVHSRLVAREKWEGCIPAHHPGYIDWDTYLDNQRRLAANARVLRGGAGGAPREGRALLAGLVRCGRCGRKMQVGYWGSAGRRPTYTCARAAREIGSNSACQRVGGSRVDQVVLDAVFAALEPASLRATAHALAQAEAEHEHRLRAFEKAVERAQYEAERARRQFDAVEPENRLVARDLEGEWEARLAEVARTEQALTDQRARRPVALTDEEAAWLERAGADLRAVFEADSTTMAERKQLLRTVLSEVTVTVDTDTKEVRLEIHFDGGACLQRTVSAPRPGWHIPATDEDTVELVRRLARHYNDTEIARILSRQGRHTAKGLRIHPRACERTASRPAVNGERGGGAQNDQRLAADTELGGVGVLGDVVQADHVAPPGGRAIEVHHVEMDRAEAEELGRGARPHVGASGLRCSSFLLYERRRVSNVIAKQERRHLHRTNPERDRGEPSSHETDELTGYEVAKCVSQCASSPPARSHAARWPPALARAASTCTSSRSAARWSASNSSSVAANAASAAPTGSSWSSTSAPMMPSTLRSSACAHTAPNGPVEAPRTATGLPRSAFSGNGPEA